MTPLSHRAALELLPAVDVVTGQVAQPQARNSSSDGSVDPLAAALRWQAAGARWIHLVDLDAAFARGGNRDVLRNVVGSLDVDVEVSGGVRDEDTLQEALATGCRRVVLGSAALHSMPWCTATMKRYGDRIAVGLDVRDDTVVPRGSTEAVGQLFEILAELDRHGCARYVITDVKRDGSLTGPNLDLLEDVCGRVSAPVIASGGISSLADLDALAELAPSGVEGAILGSALYTGAIDLVDALRQVQVIGGSR